MSALYFSLPGMRDSSMGCPVFSSLLAYTDIIPAQSNLNLNLKKKVIFISPGFVVKVVLRQRKNEILPTSTSSKGEVELVQFDIFLGF